MQERQKNQYQNSQQTQRQNQSVTTPTHLQVRNINEKDTATEQESAEKSIDPKALCYIRKVIEDWKM